MSGYRYPEESKAIIRQFAGIKSAEEIGLILGKPTHSIYQQAKKLKVDIKTNVGESHKNAKLSNLQVEMINALTVSGFKVVEIHKAAFNHVAYDTIHAVTAAYNRKTR